MASDPMLDPQLYAGKDPHKIGKEAYSPLNEPPCLKRQGIL